MNESPNRPPPLTPPPRAGEESGRSDFLSRANRGRRVGVGGYLSGFGGSSFGAQLLKLQVGSLGLTAISFVASVLLARTLGPALYGAYTLVMTAGTTIGLLRRLGQDYAATTQLSEGHAVQDRRKVRDALVFYVFMSVATSVVVLPPAILLAPWLATLFFGPGGENDLTTPLRRRPARGAQANRSSRVAARSTSPRATRTRPTATTAGIDDPVAGSWKVAVGRNGVAGLAAATGPDRPDAGTSAGEAEAPSRVGPGRRRS